jgi:glycogen debranching enzyme
MHDAQKWLDDLSTPTGLRASSMKGRFYAVFGRDTLWSVMLALEAMRYQPQDARLVTWAAEFAARNLRTLVETQGTQVNDDIEEQPGKIVHEFWREPPERLLAQGWPMQDGRYYGSVDATYLFLMATSMIWEHTPNGPDDMVESLWDQVRAALRWTLEYGDVDGVGLVEAQPHQPNALGLRNQVWKDSADSLSDRIGL